MKAIKYLIRTFIPAVATLAGFESFPVVALADTVNAIYNSATDVPVTASNYTATGSTVNFQLNCALETGTDLMVVKNSGLNFVNGTFDNLTNGQLVALSYGGLYHFVANYYGGSGNDLVLVWGKNRLVAWGSNGSGQLGNNTTTERHVPTAVTTDGVLAGKTIVDIASGRDHSVALCSDWPPGAATRTVLSATIPRHIASCRC